MEGVTLLFRSDAARLQRAFAVTTSCELEFDLGGHVFEFVDQGLRKVMFLRFGLPDGRKVGYPLLLASDVDVDCE